MKNSRRNAMYMGYPKIDRRAAETSRRSFQQTRVERPVGFTAVTPEVAIAQNTSPATAEPASQGADVIGHYDYAGQFVEFVEPRGHLIDPRAV